MKQEKHWYRQDHSLTHNHFQFKNIFKLYAGRMTVVSSGIKFLSGILADFVMLHISRNCR